MTSAGITEDAILSFLFRDAPTLARARAWLDPSKFRRDSRAAAAFLCRWFDEHGNTPSVDMVRLQLGEETVRRYALDNPLPTGADLVRLRAYLWEEFRAWVRRTCFAAAVQRAAEAIGTNDIDVHIREIAELDNLALDDDPGIDPLDDPRSLVERLREIRGAIPTGWDGVDRRIGGGIGRGEITIFSGLSGAGKSLMLQQLAVYWRQKGFVVAYVTLELSVELCGVRMAAMASNLPYMDITKDPMLAVPVPAPGRLFLRYMPGGTPTGRISSWVRSLRLVHGVTPDVVIVDYLDEVEPEGLPSNRNIPSWERDRWRARQLRDLAVREHVAMVTATQLNRHAVGQPELDIDHIGGGLGKVQVADNVIAIRADHEMRREGMIELHFLKTRSGSGVGSRIRLSWDRATLRVGGEIVGESDGSDGENDAKSGGGVDARSQRTMCGVRCAPNPDTGHSDAAGEEPQEDDGRYF